MLARERSALTACLRAVAALRRGEMVEVQRRSTGRRFRGRSVVEERTGALATTRERRRRDTIWTDGSCLGKEELGAAGVWQSPGGWAGHRYHHGSKKEVFDAEVFVIYPEAVVDQRQESGHRYKVFVDSTAAIDQVGSDALGRGQHVAIAAMRPAVGSSRATMKWPSAGPPPPTANDKTDKFAKAAARRSAPCFSEAVPDELLSEACLSYMSRSATALLGRMDSKHRAPQAPVQPPSGERPPSPALAEQQKGWPGSTTSSSPDTQQSDRTLRTIYTRSIWIGAGFASPASDSPDTAVIGQNGQQLRDHGNAVYTQREFAFRSCV